ncbi:MAG: methyltransferase family protein [Promethearchaeota archaeon]
MVLNISLVLFAVFYSLSLSPVKRAEKYEDKAWEQCARFRLIASLMETMTLIDIVIWVFHPIEGWYMPIFPNIVISLIVGAIITMPFGIIMFKGMKDAGKETMMPSSETKLYGGIYKYIRHPQTLGEFPMFPLMGLMVNSWTIFFIGLIFVVIYTPIMIKIEESDLLRRFGDEYAEYKKNTGCLLPKLSSLRKKK